MGLDEGMGRLAPYKEDEFFPKVPFGDITKGLDRFYQEPENLMFPICDALRIFKIKVVGATQAEVEAKIASIRREIKETEELLKLVR